VLVKYAFYSNLIDASAKKKFIEFGVEPKSQIAYSSGKNAVDISIVLEAMELLRSDYIDCFCLATNDSDFTPLVKRLKKYNKFVIGAGVQAVHLTIHIAKEIYDARLAVRGWAYLHLTWLELGVAT
jgi:uncharacterized protein (TIGR00288 family)